MPPPSTGLSAIQHHFSIYRQQGLSWATANGETLQAISGLGIFLVKMLSITQPCRPAAMREGVWYPLMAAAALELAFRTKIGWRTVATLAMAHAAVLWGAVRLGGGMCGDGGIGGIVALERGSD